MSQVIPFPSVAKPRPVSGPVCNPNDHIVKLPVSEYAAARWVEQATECAAAALLDLAAFRRSLSEGRATELTAETLTSLVEALRLTILASGCSNIDRPLMRALCNWSEETKGQSNDDRTN